MVMLITMAFYAMFPSILLGTKGKLKEIKFDGHTGLSEATVNIIENFFAIQEFNSIIINVANGNDTNLAAFDLGNEIIQRASEQFSTMVIVNQTKPNFHQKIRSPMVLLIDSIAAFDSVKTSLRGIYPKYYLIVLVNGVFEKINEIVEEFWKHSLIDVNFLIANDTHVSIFTYFPFNGNKCGTDTALYLINTYDSTRHKWMNATVYPDKVSNLLNCSLTIGTTEAVPMVIINNSSSEVQFDGIEIELIRKLGKIFNFHPKFVAFDSIGSPNAKPSSGLLGTTFNRTTDVAIGTLSLQSERKRFLSATSMFDSVQLIAVVPYPNHVSPFKKLILPFDLITWILLIIIFITGFLVIVSTKSSSPFLYKLIVGRNVNFPFTNMLVAFFGQTQRKLPTGNFSRFLLGKFLVFSLLIRCVYQGKLYDLMEKEMFENMPKSFDELLRKNFTFYTYESLSKRVQGFRFERK